MQYEIRLFKQIKEANEEYTIILFLILHITLPE
jgi:hypothetical protein